MVMMYPFSYHVQYYDRDKLHSAQGVTFGETFTEAMNHVEAYYGDTLQSCKVVSINDAQSVIELSAKEVEELEYN